MVCSSLSKTMFLGYNKISPLVGVETSDHRGVLKLL